MIHRTTIPLALVMSLVVLTAPAQAGDATSATNDVPVRRIVEVGLLIDRVQNNVVKSYLQARLQAILASSNSTERVSQFDAYVAELQAAAPPSAPATNAAPAPAPTPSAATNAIDLSRDVEAINLLTKYACILYDLEGHGYVAVRKELVDNVITTGLQAETLSLLRQLILTCDEAERTFHSMDDAKEDAAEATRSLYLQNLGMAGVTSITTGDPIPLLKAAAGIAGGQIKVKRERNRKLDIEIRNHQARLVNFLFALNVRHSDLKAAGAAENDFLTKAAYEELQKALREKDAGPRLAALEGCHVEHPAFREALYCLAAALHETGRYDEAEKDLWEVADQRAAVLRCDGLRGSACDILSAYCLQRADYPGAARLASEALAEQPQRAGAYNHLSLARMNMGDARGAVSNLTQALKLEPGNGTFLWTAAQLASQCYSNNDAALGFLDAAIQSGFNNFIPVYCFAPLRDALASGWGQHVLQPPLRAACNPGLLNHEFSVNSLAPYPLDQIEISLRIRYETSEGPPRDMEFKRQVKSLPARGSIFIARAMPPRRSTRCLMHLTYKCAQHPAHRFETFTCYNWNGDHENRWMYECLHGDALDALENGAAARYADAYLSVLRAADLTDFREPAILDTCARLAAKTGHPAEAQRCLSELYKVEYQTRLVNTNLIEQSLARLDDPAMGPRRPPAHSSR